MGSLFTASKTINDCLFAPAHLDTHQMLENVVSSDSDILDEIQCSICLGYIQISGHECNRCQKLFCQSCTKNCAEVCPMCNQKNEF